MALLVGFNVLSLEGIDDNANLTPAHDEYLVDYWPPHESEISSYVATGFTDNLPVSIASENKPGSIAYSYVQDYYFRVHIVPNSLVLGAVVSTQQRNIEVWSAYFVDNDLTAINETATFGMTLVGPALPATTFAPLESRQYVLTASLAGPANVNALYQFVFDLDLSALTVFGTRVVAFPFSPDWSESVVERLEWLTEVFTAFSGKEQRVTLRNAARFGIEYRVLIGGDYERVLLENTLEAWQARVFGVPLWYQVQTLAAELSIGVTSVPAETDESEFVVGGLLAITRGVEAELIEVASIGAGTVTTATPTTKTWAKGSKVMPVRLARIVNDQSTSYLADSIVLSRVRFEGIGEHATTPLSEGADYLGDPVFLTRTDWSNEVGSSHHRHTTVIDNSTGLSLLDDRSGVASVTRSHSWLLGGRAGVSAFRAWLSARAGRRVAFWFPSHQNDVLLLSNIGSPDTSITVENRGYTRLPSVQVGRRDIMIWLNDGTRFYRRIVSSVENSDTVEVMEIDTSLGQAVTVAEVRMISFMRLSRLASDAVEISHETDAIARVSAQFTSIRDDTP